MTRFGILLLLLSTLAGCATSVAHQNPMAVVAPSPSVHLASPARDQPTPINIGNTLGVIVLSDNYGQKDFIRIYNQDGSLWHQFSFFYDATDNDYEYAKEDFRPFAFHPDYFLLTFTCVGKDKGRYEVIVNNETRLKKYVNNNDPTLRFETWSEHVSNVFSISFNQLENPILKSPNGIPLNPKLFSPQTPVSPIEIKGEWLRVKWSNTLPSRDNDLTYETAWIRWKKDGHLLIELGYLC